MRRGREERAARVERRRDHGRVEVLEPGSDPRAVLERPQQRATGVDRVVESAGLEREEECQVGVLRRDLTRLRRPGAPPGRRWPCGGHGRVGRAPRRPRRARARAATTTPASRIRRRRARRRASWSSRSCAAPLASRKARSSAVRSARSSAQSSAAASRAPRYSSPWSRPIASHAWADRVRCRWARRLSRSSFSHPRSLGHSRMSASWANCTVPSSTVTSRA